MIISLYIGSFRFVNTTLDFAFISSVDILPNLQLLRFDLDVIAAKLELARFLNAMTRFFDCSVLILEL